MDLGAEVSLLHKRVYDSLKFKPKLIKRKVNLQSVNGNSLNVLGAVNVCFQMKNVTTQSAKCRWPNVGKRSSLTLV